MIFFKPHILTFQKSTESARDIMTDFEEKRHENHDNVTG